MSILGKITSIRAPVDARLYWRLILSAILFVSSATTIATPLNDWPTIRPASRIANLLDGRFHAASEFGRAVIAVGDSGLIAVSQDHGKSFTQATFVPVRTTLTQVFFVNAQNVWAVGHDGVILRSDDGGVHWKLVRSTPGAEAPLFDIYFISPQHGFAAGLFGTILETTDGGVSWEGVQNHSPHLGQADRHLFKIWSSDKGTLFIATESGGVLRSNNHGQSWQQVSTGFKGALWYGKSLSNGYQIVCGMRGALYLSRDDGLSWRRINSGVTDSLASIGEFDGHLIVTGSNGLVLSGRNDAQEMSTQRLDSDSVVIGVAHGDGRRRYVMSKGLIK